MCPETIFMTMHPQYSYMVLSIKEIFEWTITLFVYCGNSFTKSDGLSAFGHTSAGL